ncbi:MAG: GGDEF domain-containing protein [Acidobacteria bacterium]|mgnify:CR=1 FL=1|nr:MAG: GGDEF domain-containing protein [Acidobacteriota bacterium]REK06206.1 MAG: GGDEF domain-containing protein [Acidobacteriota bacterium]
MELIIWRWSTAVQLTSVVMIAVFFVVLSRSVRVANLRWWVTAWLANLVALGVANSFWIFQPQSTLSQGVLRGLYMGGKTAFVVFLVLGAWALKRPGSRMPSDRLVWAGVALYGLCGALLVRGIVQLGVVQQGAMGVFFTIGTVLLLRAPLERPLAWLVTGFALRSVLAFVESASYAIQSFPDGTFSEQVQGWSALVSAAHSSFDSGTEWLIALGCVLWLSERTQRELRDYNQALLSAQEELRRLADRDPLTGLVNRRGLPAILRRVQPEGATLLFFDLDDFKQINDLQGHQAGDRCLQRFASALEESFRPEDAIVRYAGDEFLVVAAGLGPEAMEQRIAGLRGLLGADPFSTRIRFSVGTATLPAGGDPEAALEQADEAMYRAKQQAQVQGRGQGMRVV